ncbi:MAG: hypothetical protein HGB35_04205 [Geobacteraceae bacterium]|nr:hypothetical protein [Geobacteraceae bacterium]
MHGAAGSTAQFVTASRTTSALGVFPAHFSSTPASVPKLTLHCKRSRSLIASGLHADSYIYTYGSKVADATFSTRGDVLHGHT